MIFISIFTQVWLWGTFYNTENGRQFQNVLPFTDDTLCPNVVGLYSTLQSPLVVAFVLTPLSAKFD